MKRNFNLSFLNANVIKILAAIFMVIDHVGLVFFPCIELLRISGRLSMPLFAFMIAEGTKYTKNKLKYFLLIFSLGSAFQVVYYVVEESFYMGILITFSTSILMIYALQFFKEKIFNGSCLEKIYSFLLFVLSVIITFILNKIIKIDYGFCGCMLAVFASLFHFSPTAKKGNRWVAFLDTIPINVLTFSLGLILLCVSLGGIQYYALLSLPILFMYSGKRGKLKLKYFFYIFYPSHLVIIYSISMII